MGEVAHRVIRKNEGNQSDLPLTISAQHGLVDQRDYFNNQVASRDMSGYYLLENGEFAYNKSTSGDSPWGAIKRLTKYEKGCLSTLYICFGLDLGDPDFLVTYYETNRWHGAVQMIAAEGARNHGLLNIAPDDFFETVLTLPRSTEEQKQIGCFFTQLNSLITLHQRKCQYRGLYGYLSWEQRKLGEMVDRYKELVPTPRNGYVRMGVRSHAKGTFLTEVEPGQQIEEQELSKVKTDNLVVSIVFAWEHAVAITSADDAKALVSHRFPQFSFHDDMEPGFFRYAILDEAFRWHLWLASPSGAGRNKTLNVGTMLEYEFSVPKKAEQAKIAAFFDRLDDLITLHQ